MSQFYPSYLDSRYPDILPTVKCSNCGLTVPVSTLSDHVCRQQAQQPRMYKGIHLRTRSGPGSMPSQPAPMSRVPFPSKMAPRTEDYMPGGESGMAGVGRRGFQAVARAVAAPQHPFPVRGPPGVTNRTGNQSRLLNTRTAGRSTPPLSPNSTNSEASSRSHSPHSLRPQSPLRGAAAISTSPPLPTSRSFSKPVQSPPDNSPSTDTPGITSRLPFLQNLYKNTIGQLPSGLPTLPQLPSGISKGLNSSKATPPRPASPANSEVSIGLPYDRDEGDESSVGRLSLEEKERVSKSSKSAYSAKPRVTRDDIDLPSPRRSRTTPAAGARGGPSSVPGSAARTKNPRRDMDARTARKRVCIRCERNIDDGRWVRTDTDRGILCEPCWKNMYLPKCRRCGEPIEKAAVFSSDGQLKGKYHPACFTCRVCRRPFPDKSFYVYDGHPLCAFHYHEANRSLCASRTCGKPIEGPCAVGETGNRFHPDCLRCEHPGCRERLADYWEVNGKKLCERHAQRGQSYDDDDEEERDTLGEMGRIQFPRRPPRLGSGEGRGQKRTTRLINLGGGVR